MKSPITGKDAILHCEPSSLTFRKEKFDFFWHYYFCEDSGEKFTTDELDDLGISQVYNQYREKYRIPFPEEIREIRRMYDVSANKMSEILGLGTNAYRLYESGEIPSVSNGRLILSVKDPATFIRQVQASSHILTEKEVKKLVSKAEQVIADNAKHAWDLLFLDQIFENQAPSTFNGFKRPDMEKISNMIAFFDSKIKGLYKTKLNKLLFYADFTSYARTGYAISGISYRAIQFGPVPSQYQKMYVKLCDDAKLSIDQVEVGNGNYGEVISTKNTFDPSQFSEIELKTLADVCEVYGKMQTAALVDASHLEKGWIDNEQAKSFISFQDSAFYLLNNTLPVS
ncbi:type II toxin-antitoxin system antitoxin SocA domain-containing protein [Dyadobacter sp. CY326]|uniref:type II toxin-antitoxin system antitoxin SocA domain-containing protein n=1 Tax=Dyadobacter sp. CY326 TaxID=2907300 RepID=UPI001F214871|nr:type II toxin-antitoxin system antitoxin SocA domain-containing protein [Dyadobacter sp. CY326]MCE7063913.1 DUF4065 domain-containing protein [Dyadobacter sp. CY326]